jgi:hypothetical protein
MSDEQKHNLFRGPIQPADAPAAIYEYVIPAESRRIVEDMLAMLERLEWCACIGIDWQEGSGAILGCECCQMEKADGHQPDCELAALLKRARGES